MPTLGVLHGGSRRLATANRICLRQSVGSLDVLINEGLL
jgi:hypothetical protein